MFANVVDIHSMKNEKCERCLQEWTLPDTHTKLIYCWICKGMFCFTCWNIQRAEENKKAGIARGDFNEVAD